MTATAEPPSITRPTTRGELAQRLKNGERCEVAEFVSSMTSLMLRGWLNVENFTVTASPNPGWVIYTPTQKTDAP